MKHILGRVWAALVITGIISFLSAPSLAVGLPSSPSNNPTNPMITFIKLTDGTAVKMIDTTKAPLILDKQGCRYEPADAAKPVTINNDVKITMDGISVYDAVIGGDLYVYGDNAVLDSLVVKGKVFIVSGQNVAMDYCSIDDDIEIMNQGTEDTAAYGGTQPQKVLAVKPQDVLAVNSGADGDNAADTNTAGEETADTDLNFPAADPNSFEIDTGDSANAPDSSNTPDNAAALEDKPTDKPAVKPAVVFLESISIDDYNSRYVVANKTRKLPAGWKPKDLVAITVPYRGRAEARFLRKEASDALARLFAAAKKDKIALTAISGFRSYELQKSVYYKYTRQLGEKTAEMVSAKPGSSEHQTGLAIDISSRSINYALSNSFANTREGKWLAVNAAEFGFILRYPKGMEALTGYVYEPWHFRYIGIELAADMTKKGVTLEEYYGIAPKDIGQKLIAGQTPVVPALTW